MTTPVALPTLRNQAATHHKHARGCKKAPDACPTCTSAMAWFRSLPAPVLSQVLADFGKPVKQGSY